MRDLKEYIALRIAAGDKNLEWNWYIIKNKIVTQSILNHIF